MDTCVGTMICFIHAFSQSILGIIHLPIPFLFVPCVGLFLAIYYIYSIRHVNRGTSQQWLTYFLAQQFYSLYFLVTRDIPYEGPLASALDAYFLFTASCGVCLAYHMSQIVKQRPSFSALVIVPSSSAVGVAPMAVSVSSLEQQV